MPLPENVDNPRRHPDIQGVKYFIVYVAKGVTTLARPQLGPQGKDRILIRLDCARQREFGKAAHEIVQRKHSFCGTPQSANSVNSTEYQAYIRTIGADMLQLQIAWPVVGGDVQAQTDPYTAQ